MANLQELYDFYLETQPSAGKIRNATNFLIHACQALNVSSPEEIGDEKLPELPLAIDRYFADNSPRAIRDKSALAEMIGRYGPKDGWRETFEVLLQDPDENLRQFVLQSLEYSARTEPELALPYLERFRKEENALMRRVTAMLVLRILCSEQKDFIQPHLLRWIKEDSEFAQVLIELMELQTVQAFNDPECRAVCQNLLRWLERTEPENQ